MARITRLTGKYQTAEEFAQSLEQLADEHDADVNTVIAALAADIHSSISVGSPDTGSPGQPVDTGFLRNSWVADIGEPQFDTDGLGVKRDSEGAIVGTLPAASQVRVASAKMGDRIVVATNCVYAEVIENSHETRAGSVRQTVANVQNLVDGITRRMRER